MDIRVPPPARRVGVVLGVALAAGVLLALAGRRIRRWNDDTGGER